MEDYKFLFKVVLVGNAGVGKTCLVRRFTQGLFPPGQGATIGVDFMIKTVEIDNEKVKVTINSTTLTSLNLTSNFKITSAANMGHCGPGALPIHHAELLQVSARPHPRLRHLLPADFRLPPGLVAGNRGVRQQQGAPRTRWQ